MNLKIGLHFNREHNYLDVRAGFSDAEFDGSVEKVVRRDNMTVGLRHDDYPVYVRIRGAEVTHALFAEAARFIQAGEQQKLELLQEKMSAECLAIMQELALAYRSKALKESMAPQNVKLAFEPVA